MKNQVDFKVYGRYALFTDPITKIGGEKCSYHIPTYEAVKGIAKSVYWKPTFIWIIDRVRVMKSVRTESKSMKPVNYGGIYPSARMPGKKQAAFHDLAIYTYLADVEYQVQAHIEWNLHRPDMEQDRHDGAHYNIALRMIKKGGRRDIFLGTRECQAYVEPCVFGEGTGAYDTAGEITYGLMFHGFDYPDEIGRNELYKRFWRHPRMKNGVIEFPGPADETLAREFVREMTPYPPRSSGLQEEEIDS